MKIRLDLLLFQQPFLKFKKKLKETFQEDRSPADIKKFIKENLNYSYKKGSSRVLACKEPSLRELQAIFFCRMLRALRENEILINIDESSYKRSVKLDYSWFPRGISSPIVNTRWIGRTSIIFALMSEGNWLCMNVDGTTKSSDYWLFLMILCNYVKYCIPQNQTPIKLVVDNASIHLSQQSKRAATFLNFEIHSLPPYSPNLSLVEMVFGMSKRSIAGTLRHTKINFSESTGRKEIINSFRWLNTPTVLKLWGNFVKEAKGWIRWSRKVYLESRAFTRYA